MFLKHVADICSMMCLVAVLCIVT